MGITQTKGTCEKETEAILANRYNPQRECKRECKGCTIHSISVDLAESTELPRTKRVTATRIYIVGVHER